MPQTTLGQWIRENRQQANLNQTQLGTELEVHQVTVSNWETGKAEPDPEALRALEAFFGNPTPRQDTARASESRPTVPSPPLARPKAATPPKRTKTKAGVKTSDFRHEGQTRTNIPTAKTAGEGLIPKAPRTRYSFDPHLPPLLRFDETGRADTISDRILDLIEKAGTEHLTKGEQSEIRDAVRHSQPWLEWAGKREQQERGYFHVDPVALHIHERVSARAVLRAARREDLQRALFADPQLPYQKAVQFYQHDIDWTNRMILGDSLQVMNSLAQRERLAGKVQMIYMDPPYGIRYGTNFQPLVRKIPDKGTTKAKDLTREAEMVRAYRDTWSLGVHTYLAYVRDRLRLAHELLSETGSLFFQINDEHLHRVKSILDEVFGPSNFCAVIAFVKTSGVSQAFLPDRFDHLLWFAKDKTKARSAYRQLFLDKSFRAGTASTYTWLELADSSRRGMRKAEKDGDVEVPQGSRFYKADNITSQGNPEVPFEHAGREYTQAWKTNTDGMRRLASSNRLHIARNSLQYVRYLSDFPAVPVTKLWSDTGTGSFTDKKIYVVQTANRVIERCILMTTGPGDLVLDPTCGSGTTAYMAEKWGRRWVTIDTSRVAIALARQRLLTAKYDAYVTAEEPREDGYANPGAGFRYESVPHITLRSIAQNSHLDPIFKKHAEILEEKLSAVNEALYGVDDTVADLLEAKLRDKTRQEGKRAITSADHRRWLLPPNNRERSVLTQSEATVDLEVGYWREWEVPFDTDPDWPDDLQRAVADFRSAWRAKMEEVDACIEANAPQEDLVDRPVPVENAVRVSGPFTVEGVMPVEFPFQEQALVDGPTGELPLDDPSDATRRRRDRGVQASTAELQNVTAYLHRMVQLLRADGVTFPNNQHRSFARIEALFEDGSGSAIHAEALWEGMDDAEPNTVALGFGPQYGPVTASQVEELIRASRRYDELVIAGFSFDGAATAIIQEQSHPRLTIHQAHVRPDLNPAMEGLLQDPKKRARKSKKKSRDATARAASSHQLFTVFGLPEIQVSRAEGSDHERVCELLGVDIYDPLTGDVKPTGASKVAAWFLDSDYDGRCFCITQAFFPNQNAWEKIQKALKTSADPRAFNAFKGTTSLPFEPGKHRRIAVKAIDPRGNEVMAVRTLED